MECNDMVPIGKLIELSRSGGWGSESSFDGSARVAVIRGADFPSVQQGNYKGLPIRFEKKAKVESVELRAGDIVLENSGGTATRPTGRTVLITQTLIDSYDCPIIPASFCRLLRFSSSIDNTFAFYWLQEMYRAGRTWSYQNRSTGLSNFQFKVFSATEYIPVISAEEQQRIAYILAEVDKKIALNNRTNGYLEDLLLSRYDYLFNKDGIEPNGVISDIGEVVGGATPSKKKPEYYTQQGIGWITPRDLSNTTDKFIAHGADDITQLGYDSCSVRLMPAGTVLFSSRAPIGYVAIAADEVTTNQGFKSIVPNDDIGTAFIYCFLKQNKERIADAGSGTTFPEVSGRTMKSIELVIPDKDQCAEFSEWASPILEHQQMLEVENHKLKQLRDTLLPKLMSGEIDVSKVEVPTPPNSHLSGR
ncbi:restriction endonuclease subunit S [Tractidigestivibacter montrealensis]|uniref:Restriction endonuclease subunit S n=1 Tax=Tractidigestivibacter montrealensis TaxID=2972466 RepID=A0ABT1Z5D8_9ACTN|nr:restriction endonuclease subunit S [Tractidigestivibacter montrealensis]MCR9035425.1 restriction endonuclease subunit S [Tractidigestivibacter montrealensis]